MHHVGFYYKNIPVVQMHTTLVAIGVFESFYKERRLVNN
jgi:hypothetical protein